MRERFPDLHFDFLTGESTQDLVRASGIFNQILTIPSGLSRSRRVQSAFRVGSIVRRNRYDIVLDLQRNWMSRIIRMMARPSSWAEFDRFSPLPAGLRTLSVFHAAGFSDLELRYAVSVDPRARDTADRLLAENGWAKGIPTVVLNPAGLWESRNWPLTSYRDLGRLWLSHEKIQFLLLGTNRIQAQAKFLEHELGDSVINLTGRTSLGTALAALQRCSLVVSEDSGLLHMSWVSGIPTIALFGSSRADWSRPMGNHSVCLSSADLECGQCMRPSCRFGDVHCLTRHTAQSVFDTARKLLSEHLAGFPQ